MSNGNGKTVGKVKFYSRSKGYGFIERTNGSSDRDVFVHAKDLPYGVVELLQNQKVAFVLENGVKGPRAKQVELVS